MDLLESHGFEPVSTRGGTHDRVGYYAQAGAPSSHVFQHRSAEGHPTLRAIIADVKRQATALSLLSQRERFIALQNLAAVDPTPMDNHGRPAFAGAGRHWDEACSRVSYAQHSWRVQAGFGYNGGKTFDGPITAEECAWMQSFQAAEREFGHMSNEDRTDIASLAAAFQTAVQLG